jgi:hypothetical protein
MLRIARGGCGASALPDGHSRNQTAVLTAVLELRTRSKALTNAGREPLMDFANGEILEVQLRLIACAGISTAPAHRGA